MFCTQATLERVLDAASGGGADFAEVYCEDNQMTLIDARADGIDGSSSGRESGVGIRVFSGLHCYYAYSNDSREETLLRLARELTEACKAGIRQRVPLRAMRDFAPAAMRSLEAQEEGDAKLRHIRRAIGAGMAYDSEICQVNVQYLDSDRQFLVANTEGLLVRDRQVKTRMRISAYAQYRGEIQRGFRGPGAMAGTDFYDGIDLEDIARQAARVAKTTVHAKKCPSGLMTVVLDNGFCGLMFHEACGHSLEANSVSKGNSEFSGKLGQQVASPLLTLIDDGTLPGMWGSIHIDDEGTPSQRNVLIENGILKGYMIDKLESRRMGMPPTGSGRRQSYRFPPEARMTNTFIAPGSSTREEMIAATERGLFVGNINGGSVNPATGEFNFNVAECRLIENGRLAEPVYGATLIGKGGQVLRQVDMVGSDLEIGQGYCYNNSGALFIGAGQPSLRVRDMLVGGLV